MVSDQGFKRPSSLLKVAGVFAGFLQGWSPQDVANNLWNRKLYLPTLSQGGEDAVILGELRARQGRNRPAKDLTMDLFKSATGDLADHLETEQA